MTARALVSVKAIRALRYNSKYAAKLETRQLKSAKKAPAPTQPTVNPFSASLFCSICLSPAEAFVSPQQHQLYPNYSVGASAMTTRPLQGMPMDHHQAIPHPLRTTTTKMMMITMTKPFIPDYLQLQPTLSQ